VAGDRWRGLADGWPTNRAERRPILQTGGWWTV